MKRFQIFILSLVLSLFCSVLVNSQTDKIQPKNTNQIAVFFPDAFEDEKTGITDLIEVNQNLKSEFKLYEDELLRLSKRIEFVQKEITEQTSKCKLANCSHIEKMIGHYEALVSDFKTKQKDGNSRYEKRKKEETIIINQKIAEALKQFGKNNGFAVILDISKIDSYPSFSDSIYDITKEFIKFYNENFSKAKSQ